MPGMLIQLWPQAACSSSMKKATSAGHEGNSSVSPAARKIGFGGAQWPKHTMKNISRNPARNCRYSSPYPLDHRVVTFVVLAPNNVLYSADRAWQLSSDASQIAPSPGQEAAKRSARGFAGLPSRASQKALEKGSSKRGGALLKLHSLVSIPVRLLKTHKKTPKTCSCGSQASGWCRRKPRSTRGRRGRRRLREDGKRRCRLPSNPLYFGGNGEERQLWMARTN